MRQCSRPSMNVSTRDHQIQALETNISDWSVLHVYVLERELTLQKQEERLQQCMITELKITVTLRT